MTVYHLVRWKGCTGGYPLDYLVYDWSGRLVGTANYNSHSGTLVLRVSGCNYHETLRVRISDPLSSSCKPLSLPERFSIKIRPLY